MHRVRGFTLLELMIVVALSAILLTLAVPSFRSAMLSSSRAEASTSLYGGLSRARSEAIVRNAVISVCPRLGGSTTPVCSTSGNDWTQGWVVFRSQSAITTGSGRPAAGDELIAAGDATDTAFAVASNPSGTSFVQFQPSGRAAFANFSTLNFTLCKTGDSTFEGRLISVDLNGRVSLGTAAC